MNFICTICNKDIPHFKGLLDHCTAEHPDLLRRYEIKHKPSKVKLLTYSPDAKTAIKAQGWDNKDCKVRRVA